MADVEDLRSASEEEEESEDEYAYESEASTDPVADAGDQLDLDVARCCARVRRRERGALDDEGEPDAHRDPQN